MSSGGEPRRVDPLGPSLAEVELAPANTKPTGPDALDGTNAVDAAGGGGTMRANRGPHAAMDNSDTPIAINLFILTLPILHKTQTPSIPPWDIFNHVWDIDFRRPLPIGWGEGGRTPGEGKAERSHDTRSVGFSPLQRRQAN